MNKEEISMNVPKRADIPQFIYSNPYLTKGAKFLYGCIVYDDYAYFGSDEDLANSCTPVGNIEGIKLYLRELLDWKLIEINYNEKREIKKTSIHNLPSAYDCLRDPEIVLCYTESDYDIKYRNSAYRKIAKILSVPFIHNENEFLQE